MVLLLPIWFIAHCIARLTHLNLIRMTAGNFYYYFSMVMNILGIVLGCLMIVHPTLSIFSVGYIIGTYLILLGVDSIIVAVSKIGSRR